MDSQRQREIASKGGKSAHQKGAAHEFTPEEAQVAGRKGGAASRTQRIKGDREQGEHQPDQGGEGAEEQSPLGGSAVSG